MIDSDAIRILEEELEHTESHLKQKGMAQSFYDELGAYCQALTRAIESLRSRTSIWRVMDALNDVPLAPLLVEDARKAITRALAEDPYLVYKAKIDLNPKCKKNNQKIIYNSRTHKPMVMQSDVYKQYENDCGYFLKPIRQPIDFKVNIQCVFYRDSARRVDMTNLLEAIDDILVKYKILADDNFNIIGGHDGSRVNIDRINPRTEIYITRM